MRKKLMIIGFILVLVAIIPAFAQQFGDCITVRKSDLPPDVLRKIQIAQAAENPKPAMANRGQWFFLVAGLSGGFSADFFVVAGPFKDQGDCNEIRTWTRTLTSSKKVSRCWCSDD